jgi:hypothetical protein
VAAWVAWNSAGWSQDFTRVPGVVIDYEEAPTLPDKIANVNEVYIASPSITVMPNGYYVASHDLFDSGTNYDTSKVFLSKDRGATWSHQSTIVGQFWSTVFEHKGVLYFFGPQRQGGNLIIRTSTDYGRTWTEPTSSKSGLILEGKYGGTPNAPAIHNGRIWIAQSGTKVVSAPVDADLMDADSWRLTGGVSEDHGRNHFGDRWQGWSEAQVVASPRTGVVLMPKIRALPHTALFRVDETSGEVSFDGSAPNAFPSLPGGEKKFGARYDAVSERFFVLSNPVLPLEADHPELLGKPEMIRNTAGVLSSKDLVNWNVEKLFLYSPHLDDGTFGEGFQYFNFAIDGDDLAVAARSAIDVGDGQNKPPRGHDTNLMTFHRIENFRNLSPDHVLVVDIEGNQVLRFEETQHRRAPLGSFVLGTTFDGTPLRRPVQLAQSADGDVYIREEGGRTLRFDAAGNFKNAVSSDSSLPAEIRESLQTTVASSSSPFELKVKQPSGGEWSWVRPESGEWSVATNWYYWGRPDGDEETAVFGSAAEADCTVDVDEAFTVKGLRFRSDRKYTVEGDGILTLAAKDGRCLVDAEQGSHEIRAAIRLANDTDLKADEGTGLKLGGPFSLEGRTLSVLGPGRIEIGGRFSMGGGVLAVAGTSPVVFRPNVEAALDGTLALKLPDEPVLQAGGRWKLIDGIQHAGGRFKEVALPKLPDGLSWDVASLYDDGTVAVRSRPDR